MDVTPQNNTALIKPSTAISQACCSQGLGLGLN
jgi:hypothetical protein